MLPNGIYDTNTIISLLLYASYKRGPGIGKKSVLLIIKQKARYINRRRCKNLIA